MRILLVFLVVWRQIEIRSLRISDSLTQLDIDYFSYPEYSKTNLLKPYHANPEIYNMLREIDSSNIFLKISKMYPYNQKIAAILTEYYKKSRGTISTGTGYLPVTGSIDLTITGNYPSYVTDNLKAIAERERVATEEDKLVRKYFQLFIDTCKANDIRIIAFCSPRCPANPELASTPIISHMLLDEMKKNGITVDYILPSQYEELNRTDIFKDLGHLNHEGALLYSRIIAALIKKKL